MVLVIITELSLRPIQSTICKACIKEISSPTVCCQKIQCFLYADIWVDKLFEFVKSKEILTQEFCKTKPFLTHSLYFFLV